MTIRHALILANAAKDEVRELGGELHPWLAARVGKVGLVNDIRAFAAERQRLSAEARRATRPDLVVVLGGDGALLGAVRAFAEDPVPTLGINLGRVGFLASTPASRWRDTLEHVLAGSCLLEHRSRLRARWREQDGSEHSAVALNDVALQRGAHQGMLRLSLEVDGTWVTNYRADGLIVATPSGSTAYSLSAGGPVLDPAVDGIVVTPICSQGLSNRPIVLPGDGELELRVADSSGITTLVADGQSFHPLHRGELVRLVRCAERYPLYAMPELDPYRRLRDRLGWGGEHPGQEGHRDRG